MNGLSRASVTHAREEIPSATVVLTFNGLDRLTRVMEIFLFVIRHCTPLTDTSKSKCLWIETNCPIADTNPESTNVSVLVWLVSPRPFSSTAASPARELSCTPHTSFWTNVNSRNRVVSITGTDSAAPKCAVGLSLIRMRACDVHECG